MPNWPSPPIISFLRGASHPGEFVEQAAALGYAAIGIADRNSLAGVVRAYEAWEKLDAGHAATSAGRRAAGLPRRHAGHPGLSARIATPMAGCAGCSRLGKSRAPKGECFLDLADLLEYRDGLLLIVMPPADLENAQTGAGRAGAAIPGWRRPCSIPAKTAAACKRFEQLARRQRACR